jgi:hypothetical protein
MGIECVSSIDRSNPFPIAITSTGLWATVSYPRVTVNNLLYYNLVFDRKTGISRVEALIQVCPVECFSWLCLSSEIIFIECAQTHQSTLAATAQQLFMDYPAGLLAAVCTPP